MPRPIASITAAVWLLGRCKFANPWRQEKDRKAGATLRSNIEAPRASAKRTPKTARTPKVNQDPDKILLVVQTANPQIPAATRANKIHTSQSRVGFSASNEARSANRGEIRLSGTRGIKAKSSAVPSPTSKPAAIAEGATVMTVFTGKKSLSASGSVYWAAIPAAAPRIELASASSRIWIT